MTNPCLSIVLFFSATLSFMCLINLKRPLLTKDGVETVEVELAKRFALYLKKYNKSYGHAEYLKRQQHFKESLQEISRLNELQSTNVFGVTKFSDMSPQEFRNRVSGGSAVGRSCWSQHKSCPPHLGKDNTSEYFDAVDDIPQIRECDWRKSGVVGKVLDQKLCMGCWAFSIVGVMESMWAIAGHGLHALSIQELIDCSEYNNGCYGGDIGSALDFLCQKDYPIVHAFDYPLMLVQEVCKIPDQKPAGRKIMEFTTLCNVKEDHILSKIATHGPVVVVVNAQPWQHYNGGVIQMACPGEWAYLTHVVQIVGYNLNDEVPYYIIRNSWGEDFGDEGYVKLAVQQNMCGLASNVGYFTVK